MGPGVNTDTWDLPRLCLRMTSAVAVPLIFVSGIATVKGRRVIMVIKTHDLFIPVIDIIKKGSPLARKLLRAN